MKPNHFQHHRRNYNSPKLSKKKKNNPKRNKIKVKISKKLRPLLFNHNVCHFHVRVCCRCLLASPSDVKSLRCDAAAPCYRGGKGSGGLSGGWWEAETFIPGTRTAKEKEKRPSDPSPAFAASPRAPGIAAGLLRQEGG